MKTFLTTAVVVTALALPAFAEGDDPSTKAGEAKGSVKATTEQKQDVPAGSMGRAVVVPRATTGSSATDQQLNKTEGSSPVNPAKKTDVTGGNDNGGGGSGGSGGSGGGSGGSGGNQ
jgi:hypothetical protein